MRVANSSNASHLFIINNYPLFIQYSVDNLDKMLVGLTPCDEKSIKQG
jgi:hypothetical protein